MPSDDLPPHPTPQELEDEKAVRSEPLDTEDGDTVVIEQQNVGSANQLGGGEFKNACGRKSPEQAAAEQRRLEDDEPIGRSGDDHVPGVTAPGVVDGGG